MIPSSRSAGKWVLCCFPLVCSAKCGSIFTLFNDSRHIMFPRTHLVNRKRARGQRFGAAARREEGEYPLWIFDRRATRPRREKSATLRAKLWRTASGVAPQSQNAAAMLLRRALPAAGQTLAHPFPIYEMGSSPLLVGEERTRRLRHSKSLPLRETHSPRRGGEGNTQQLKEIGNRGCWKRDSLSRAFSAG